MSLSLTLKETIDEVIQTFITKVSNKYNIDDTELIGLWDGNFVKKSVKQVTTSNKIDPDTLLKCTKLELIALCKTHSYKCSGTKSILLSRLLGKEDNIESTTKDKSKSKSKSMSNVKNTDVVKKLTANIPNILIRRNNHNNYEHPETGLIFDNDTKIVIGKQNNDGTVNPLTEGDIDQCNAFKFKFKIPIDLDYKLTLTEVKVDELDEDEEYIDDDELEVVEEEEEEEEEEEVVVEEEVEVEEEEEEEVNENDLIDNGEFDDYISE